jgi:hypothetical protein
MTFISTIDAELAAELIGRFNHALLWGLPPDTRTEEEKYEDTIKFGFVFFEGDEYHTMVGVSTVDMKAYEFEEWDEERRNYYTLKKPLVEVPYVSFDRWCRPMDM